MSLSTANYLKTTTVFKPYQCICTEADKDLKKDFVGAKNLCLLSNFIEYAKCRNLLEIEILNKLLILLRSLAVQKASASTLAIQWCLYTHEMHISETLLKLPLIKKASTNLLNVTSLYCCEEFITFVEKHYQGEVDLFTKERRLAKQMRTRYLDFI